MRPNPNLDSRALMLTCGCSPILIAKSALLLRSMHVFHSQWIIRGNFFEHSELHSGMTYREFDSFLRGNANELREETCKILFMDTIRIPDRERDKVWLEMNAHFFYLLLNEYIHWQLEQCKLQGSCVCKTNP